MSVRGEVSNTPIKPKRGEHPWPCSRYLDVPVCPNCGWPDYTHKANS